jgi:hypothetical protein
VSTATSPIVEPDRAHRLGSRSDTECESETKIGAGSRAAGARMTGSASALLAWVSGSLTRDSRYRKPKNDRIAMTMTMTPTM